jgi:hypothetical protein
METSANRKMSATRWQMWEWIDASGSRWRRRLLTVARRTRISSFLFASVRSTPTVQVATPSTGYARERLDQEIVLTEPCFVVSSVSRSRKPRSVALQSSLIRARWTGSGKSSTTASGLPTISPDV